VSRLPLLLGLIVLAGALQAALAGGLVADPATAMAVPLACLGFGVIVWSVTRSGTTPEARRFLLRLIGTAFAVRLILGVTLMATGAIWFFGGDFDTYHMVAKTVAMVWQGEIEMPDDLKYRYLVGASQQAHGSRAGFYYFVAGFYYTFGISLYITIVVMSLLGALSALLVYLIGRDMFDERVGRWAGALTAFFPSVVLWTCQGYKDGLIVFCLLLAYRSTQKLQVQMAAGSAMALAVSMWAIYQVRGYIFYVAVGPIILALSNRRTGDAKVFYNQLLGLVVLGVGVIASGLGNNLLAQMQEVNLKEIHAVRSGLANEANSGIDKTADISTPGNALAYLPKGVSYFLLAPFPWQMTKASQAITFPEMCAWWSLIPALIIGIRRALKERLAESSGILIFLLVLTLVYGLSQGNVGTAYRVRAQLLVFYFIFASAGMKPTHWIARFLPKAEVAPMPVPETPAVLAWRP
jgi:hypothetical protein